MCTYIHDTILIFQHDTFFVWNRVHFSTQNCGENICKVGKWSLTSAGQILDQIFWPLQFTFFIYLRRCCHVRWPSNSGGNIIKRHIGGRFVCAFHPAAPGLSPKHTIYAFIIYSENCPIFVIVKRTIINKKEAGLGPCFNKETSKYSEIIYAVRLNKTAHINFHIQSLYLLMVKCGCG